MWWRSDQLTPIDNGIAAAADGRPTLLSVEGEPGQGKSSLLREVAARADGFHQLAAEGVENLLDRPYTTLLQWPLPVPVASGTSPFQAAQVLRRLIDRLAHSGPVLLVVDDLQWADAESVETVAWVLRRASGDRLLVAAATRPLRPPVHPSWRRMRLEDGAVRVRLDGLGLDEASRLVEESWPGADATTVRRLWEHTGGNPLYLRALVAEHDPDELVMLEELPAPGDLTAAASSRLAALPVDAAELIRAVAVLGTAWSPLAVAAELAEVEDAAVGALAGVEGGFLEQRRTGSSMQVRPAHAVLRAAVQETLPTARRCELHRRAARVVPSGLAALRHRVEATDRYDDHLAEDLVAYATELHDRAEFRQAARCLAWAGNASADSAVREARWLDSLFEYVLARDDEHLAHALPEVGWARDVVRRALVIAGHAIVTRRWLEARRIFDAVPERAASDADAKTRYRFVVLRSWCRVMSGVPAEQVLADLSWARTAGQPDHALYVYLSFALGQARLAAAGRPEGWRYAEAVPPTVASAATDTTRLAWRGTFYALGGQFEEAVDILDQVIGRVRDGLAGFGEGVFHAYLGYASWMLGDWPRAQRLLSLAMESRFGPQHPLVLACAPLVAIARNDMPAANWAARSARDALLAAPWPPAVQVTGTVTVLARRLDGTPDERAHVLPELRRAFGGAVTDLGPIASPVWLVHLALAALWAGEADLVDHVLARLELARPHLTWLPPAIDWISGLAAEHQGDLTGARRLLVTASSSGLDVLPLHRALVIDDLTRVETRLGHVTAAAATRADAAERLVHLGLALLVHPEAEAQRTVLRALSERERDVVELLAKGLSYVQIARELFVTRSTVAFHLSNVYAKTRTANRHELVELVSRSG
jgi:DNA-binding CsgD family transcriptional regulator